MRLTAALAAVAVFCGQDAVADQKLSGHGWILYCYDNSTGGCEADGSGVQSRPGTVLMGGGTDVDAAFQWMITRSGGGHFVIIRVDDDDAYNPYVWDLGNTSLLSVTTLVTKDRTGAVDATVLGRLANASAVFIAGGDQNLYMDYWNNTEVQTIIRNKSMVAPIGGTSAGMAVQPDFVYTAEGESAVSSVVLQNPYDATITLGTRFLTDAPLVGVITDTHWFQRDRLGRTLAFMARLLTDAWPGSWTSGGSGLGFGLTSMPAVRAIACDEQSAVVIDPVTRHATVLNEDTGPDHACYFMAAAATARRVCLPQTNLTLADVTVFRASSIEGGTFDLGAWAPVAGSGGASYNVSAISGILTSTQAGGALY